MFFNFFSLGMFFLLSKEFLFYGEERLIVLSYLTLFLSLFIVLHQGVISDFEHRAGVLRAEFSLYFSSIVEYVSWYKNSIKVFYFFLLKLARFFLALYSEFITFYKKEALFSVFARNWVNIESKTLLHNYLYYYTFLFQFYNAIVLSAFTAILFEKLFVGHSILTAGYKRLPKVAEFFGLPVVFDKTVSNIFVINYNKKFKKN